MSYSIYLLDVTNLPDTFWFRYHAYITNGNQNYKNTPYMFASPIAMLKMTARSPPCADLPTPSRMMYVLTVQCFERDCDFRRLRLLVEINMRRRLSQVMRHGLMLHTFTLHTYCFMRHSK